MSCLRGVVTACDGDVGAASGLLILLTSLAKTEPNTPVCIFDLGMTPSQLETLRLFENVTIRTPRHLPFGNSIYFWQTWNKPQFILDSGFDQVIWLDTDILVHTNLSHIWKWIETRPFVVKNHVVWGQPPIEKISNSLEVQPLKRHPVVNAGVLGFDLKRDSGFIREWLDACVKYLECDGITYQDQGVLNLVLSNRAASSWIEHDVRWNFHWSWDRWRNPMGLDVIRDVWDGIAYISHLCVSPKPYGNLFEVDLHDIDVAVTSKIIKPSRDRSGRGIMMALDDDIRSVSGLRLLCHSLRNSNPNVPMTVVDLGLSDANRELVSCLPNVAEIIPHATLAMPQSKPRWQAWNKPVFIKQSPYRETIWLDPDCLVFTDLSPLFEKAQIAPVLLEDASRHAWMGCEKLLPNKFQSYKDANYLAPYRDGRGPYTNTGVIAVDLENGEWLIDGWIRITEILADNPSFRDGIHWWDQGSMQWLVERYGRHDLILCDARWNHSKAFDARMDNANDLQWIYSRNQLECCISHLCGRDKPYFDLSSITDEEIGIAVDWLFRTR